MYACELLCCYTSNIRGSWNLASTIKAYKGKGPFSVVSIPFRVNNRKSPTYFRVLRVQPVHAQVGSYIHRHPGLPIEPLTEAKEEEEEEEKHAYEPGCPPACPIRTLDSQPRREKAYLILSNGRLNPPRLTNTEKKKRILTSAPHPNLKNKKNKTYRFIYCLQVLCLFTFAAPS